jgi:hypothetical protein
VAVIGSAFLLVALGGTPPGHAPWFSAPRVYSGLSGALAVGDFNNDGKPDLAVANRNSVSIVLGNGNGSFQPPLSYTVAGGATSVTVADLNGDGKLDLAMSGYRTVSILLGNGDGTFQPAVSYPAGFEPISVAVGDFNRDGKLDLAVADFGDPCCNGPPGNVAILLGNGDGTFRPPSHYAAGSNPTSIATADFNHDGKLDLAVSTDFSGVEVLLGNGDGTFQPAVGYNVAVYAASLAITDFNNDGEPDLAVADSVGVSILLGNGDGTFQAAVNYNTGATPISVAVADFSRDGKPDLAVANSEYTGDYNYSVSVLLGTGTGTFQPAINYPLGGGAGSVVAADFNRDGKPDLAVDAYPGLTILMGKGNGAFVEPVNNLLQGPPGSVVTGDFNLDGKLDLAITTSSGISVLLGKGNGAFYPAVYYPVGGTPLSLAVSDFNDDGKPDLAVTVGGTAYNISVLLGNGDGTFRPPVTSLVGFVLGSLAVGDFNLDGKPDLAVINNTSSPNSPGVVIALGNGDGTFQYPSMTYFAGPNAGALAVADVNDDGKPDVVVVNYDTQQGYGPGSVAILLGNGNGTLASPVQYDVGNGATSVVVGDFNGDGKLDLAVGQTAVYGSASSVSILLGYGGGYFLPAVNYAVGTGQISLAIGEFNGDGKPDLAIANNGFPGPPPIDTVSILLGNGDGTFLLSRVSFEVGQFPNSVAVGDFNQDGKLDLAVTNFGSNNVSVLINTTR